ncbi:MAG: hypothetical protein M3Y40_08420 [Chloroflexota bacterium]|nr:hypothetical protein [Chloroflexota bacterium]
MTIPTPGTPDVEQAVQRVQELSQQAIEASKASGRTWLDAYEKMLDSFLKLQQQAAQGTQVEWVNTLANTNADFVREMSQVYLTAVRDQLK